MLLTIIIFSTGIVTPVYATALPQSELQALTEYPEWVGCSGGGSTVASSAGPVTTPDTSSCSCTSGVSSGAALIGSNNVQKVWNYFKGLGLSDAQTAGILGNMEDESGPQIDPEINQNGSGDTPTQPTTGGADGWGIVQWTYPSQDVNQLVKQYNISGPVNELSTQLALVWAQMKNTSPTGQKDILSTLKTINDPGQAASFFDLNFEGGVSGVRVSNAQNIYSNRAQLDASGGGSSSSGTQQASSGSGSQTATSGSAVTSATLNGHVLPATQGGTGEEQLFPSYGLGTPANQNANNYYITMRWRYQKWNWDGTSVPGPEDIAFYQKHPLVLVTNPRNHKSIIADALEAGPAPWTGVDPTSNNNPKQGWVNPQDGTPPNYTGRVSGFPPVAFQALGAIEDVGGQGDKLLYAWAPDQNATPGPTSLQVGDVTNPTSSACGATGAATTSGTYQSPFKSNANVVASRIDEGADYSTSSSVPVYAIGNGVVTASYNGNSNWYPPLPNWLTYKLTDGPAAGKYIYVAEDCPPLVRVGDQVSPSSGPLCNMGPRSIETGWAADGTSQLAAAGSAYAGHGGFETAYGVNFNKLMVSLGAPNDHLDTSSDPSGTVLGTLPGGWPTW